MIALDASALLAFLFREAGHERVGALIDDACLSAVNLSEVIARFVRDGHDPPAPPSRLSRSQRPTLRWRPPWCAGPDG